MQGWADAADDWDMFFNYDALSEAQQSGFENQQGGEGDR